MLVLLQVLPLDHQDVNVGYDNGTDRVLIIWPVIVIHKIDKDSPFWRMSQSDLEKENFELIVVLEGMCPISPACCHSKSCHR